MIQTPLRTLTLEAFLQLPETKPASEYMNGEVIQKPMPKSRHSRLQGKLGGKINEATEAERIAYAFPELRCTFGQQSVVPDLAVLRWSQIEFDPDGEPLDNVLVAPCWTIEILSPNQSANRVAENILHCLSHGSELGWLLDPGDRSVLVFLPNQQPKIYRGQQTLPIPAGLPLTLTAAEVFGWLKMAERP